MNAVRIETARRRHPACRCGAHYAESAFAELAPVQVLRQQELAGIVVRWPDGMIVDVRACAACASPIARLASKPSAQHGAPCGPMTKAP